MEGKHNTHFKDGREVGSIHNCPGPAHKVNQQSYPLQDLFQHMLRPLNSTSVSSFLQFHSFNICPLLRSSIVQSYSKGEDILSPWMVVLADALWTGKPNSHLEYGSIPGRTNHCSFKQKDPGHHINVSASASTVGNLVTDVSEAREALVKGSLYC